MERTVDIGIGGGVFLGMVMTALGWITMVSINSGQFTLGLGCIFPCIVGAIVGALMADTDLPLWGICLASFGIGFGLFWLLVFLCLIFTVCIAALVIISLCATPILIVICH